MAEASGRISLPQRSTRGKRLTQAVEDEIEADESFWNQQFFAEDNQDEDYQSEAEEADVVDSDFYLSEASSEGDGEQAVQKEKRRTLKPPGYTAKPAAVKRPVGRPSKSTAPAVQTPTSQHQDEDQPKQYDVEEAGIQSDIKYQAPTLRRSTVYRVTEAEKERKRLEKLKPKRRKVLDAEAWRPLTQEELLAEAAKTEVENIASLQAMLDQEEETKRKAVVVKKTYNGPYTKYHSFREGDVSKTVIKLYNMREPPPWMRTQRAPQPVKHSTCSSSAAPHTYRDPVTGQPFSSIAAFQQLRSGTLSNPSRSRSQQLQDDGSSDVHGARQRAPNIEMPNRADGFSRDTLLLLADLQQSPAA